MSKSVGNPVEAAIGSKLIDAATAPRHSHNPHPPPDILQSNKWLAASCLQKSIRRGLPDTAQSAATALLSLDPDYAFTRLGVIAFEDIGLGNPDLCGAVLLARRKAIRNQVDEAQLLHYLVDQCVTSTKDRTATDLLCLGIYNPQVDQLEQQCRTATPEQLVEIALDVSMPWAMRSSALKCLAGFHKFENGKYEVFSPPRMSYLMDICEALGVPPTVQYLIRTGQNKTSYLNAMLPLVHQLISSSPTLAEKSTSIATPLICGIPAATFDTYTQQGKQGMAYFAKACPPVRQFFERHPKLKPVAVLGMLLFHIEGSLLDRHLDFVGRTQILEEIEAAEMASVGISDSALVTELRGLVLKNMVSLNSARQKILKGAAS